jgi:hypothetical protein
MSMSHLPPEASCLARRQHGAISSDQLSELGVRRHQRQSLVRAGVLSEMHRSVYRFVSVPDSLEQRCAAACLADPELVISGPTAGILHRLRRMPRGSVHTMSRHRVDLDDIVAHRTNRLDLERDVIHRGDGIRVLAIPRLVFDLARFLDDNDFESVIEQLLDRRLTSIPVLFATGRSLQKAGRDGSARFGRVLARRPAWAKPKGSTQEVTLFAALQAAGVTLTPQLTVELPDGWPVHIDGGDRARRVGIEVDHVTWHGGRAESQYDKWRDRQLARISWLIVRVTDEDINRRLDETVREIVEVYESRRVA